jgi:hypothetical protein
LNHLLSRPVGLPASIIIGMPDRSTPVFCYCRRHRMLI